MKETIFYIIVSIKTCNGFENILQFFIGNDKKRAAHLFSELQGDDQIDEGNILLLELMEKRDGLPLNIQMIRCSLEELGENCKLITKYIFTLLNMKKQP